MPIVPPGVGAFEIQPPITSSQKDGHPTASLLRDAQRVFHLIQDERHLTAEDLLQSVEQRLAQHEASAPNIKGRRNANRAREKGRLEIAQVKELLADRSALLEKLKVCANGISIRMVTEKITESMSTLSKST